MENTQYEDAMEAVGQAVFELPEEDQELPNKLLDLIEDAYIPIKWPWVQDFMELEWFREEAILDIDSKLGDSTYLIPIQRAMELK